MPRSLTRLLLTTALLLAACGEDDERPFAVLDTGRMRFVNATPDTAKAKALTVRIDDVTLVANQAYKGTTSYVLAVAGGRRVTARRTTDTSIVALETVVTIAPSTDFTVLATGITPDVAGLVLTDDNTAPAAGNVKIRIVNGSPAAGAVDVYVTAPGADLSTETPDATSVGFRAVAAYLALPAGTYRIRWTTPTTTTVVGDTTTAALATGQIRTVVLLDKAGGGTPHTYAILSDR